MSIDPKSFKCNNCNSTWKPRTYHRLVMLVRGEYSRKCPQCGTVMKFRLVHHVVRLSSEKVLDEKIWRRC
ncbi:MAG: hypothetical protein IKF79_01365 [Methanosphaera sp.]|nr:hypothetical protein [Methanosphaera sp.]